MIYLVFLIRQLRFLLTTLVVPRPFLTIRFIMEAARNDEIGKGFPHLIKPSCGTRHCYSLLLKTHKGSHNLPTCLDMSASVRLILLIDEALHHSLFLELNLLDIHGILPLIINGLELELKS